MYPTQVLTDILGIEDALGGMDFKVAGSRDGISAFQLDVKELGLKAETLEKALAQAREARLHVLDEMASRGVDEPQQLSDSVPKTKTLQVEPNKIGKIIGKGGETIRGLIADCGVEINLSRRVFTTPSKRRPLDGVALRSLTAPFNRHGRDFASTRLTGRCARRRTTVWRTSTSTTRAPS